VWRWGTWRNCSHQCRRSGGLTGQGDLLDEKVRADIGESRERPCALDEGRHVREFLVEAAEKIENKSSVKDRLTQVPQGICHAFHLVAVSGDGKITLDESPEFRIKDYGTSLLVANELVLWLTHMERDVEDGVDTASTSSGVTVLNSHDFTVQSMRCQ
jgi:hypothetical protein